LSTEPGPGDPLRAVAAKRDAVRPRSVGTHEATRRPNPAALHYGPGHVVVHGNQAFLDTFGRECLGLPAREALVLLPHEAFEVMDAVFERGRPLGRWITTPRGRWRLTVIDRRDPETGEVYGVASHLRREES